MKIAIFSTTFFPQAGGAERFIHGLATELVKTGEEVFLIVPFGQDIENFNSEYKILRLRFLHLFPANSYPYLLVLFLNLFGYAMRHRFHVLQVVGLYPAGFAATWLKRAFPRLKIFARATGSDIQVMPEIDYGLRLDKKVDRRICESVSRFDKVIANSESIRSEFLDLNVDDGKVQVIPNAVDLNRFQITDEKKRAIKEKYCGNPDVRIVLSVGRVEKRKNYSLLLYAFKKTVEVLDDVYCVIVGSGGEQLASLVAELELPSRVVLTGRLPKEGKPDFSSFPSQELLDLYMSSDVFAFPSILEGQPNVLLEALAAGLPIVAHDAPGSKDVVTNGETGFLVVQNGVEQFSAKLLDLLTNEELRERMSESAKIEAQKYTWDSVARRYLDVYAQKKIS